MQALWHTMVRFRKKRHRRSLEEGCGALLSGWGIAVGGEGERPIQRNPVGNALQGPFIKTQTGRSPTRIRAERGPLCSMCVYLRFDITMPPNVVLLSYIRGHFVYCPIIMVPFTALCGIFIRITARPEVRRPAPPAARRCLGQGGCCGARSRPDRRQSPWADSSGCHWSDRRCW